MSYRDEPLIKNASFVETRKNDRYIQNWWTIRSSLSHNRHKHKSRRKELYWIMSNLNKVILIELKLGSKTVWEKLLEIKFLQVKNTTDQFDLEKTSAFCIAYILQWHIHISNKFISQNLGITVRYTTHSLHFTYIETLRNTRKKIQL